MELDTKKPKGLLMNPHAPHSISPIGLIRSIKTNRSLILSLIKRDVMSRYRGSIMGLLWSFLNPVFMLVVYTFVFSVVFKARWIGGSDSKVEFAIVLFIGLLVFNLFSEVVSRAPSLILSNANYVKKVIFPLEILPFVALGSALFHMIVSLSVWLIFYLIFFGLPGLYALQLPFILIPLILNIIGLTWILSSLSVYLRDLGQIVSVLITVLMFASPIFYPVAVLPLEFQNYMLLNPLTFIVEETRNVMIWGKYLDWSSWIIQLLISFVLAWVGYAWFQKIRKGFADVI